jgi:hypothetical protein
MNGISRLEFRAFHFLFPKKLLKYVYKHAKISDVLQIDNFKLFCKLFIPHIKINKYAFPKFRNKISVATLQRLYCPQLMQHYLAALH